MCHNEKLSSGGLNITPLLDPASISANRQVWERVVSRVQTGEMPPKGVPKPAAADIEALVKFVEREFDRADATTVPNPGRVTAKRLNRAEYANTVRDLLGVSFRADEEFPAG